MSKTHTKVDELQNIIEYYRVTKLILHTAWLILTSYYFMLNNVDHLLSCHGAGLKIYINLAKFIALKIIIDLQNHKKSTFLRKVLTCSLT